MTTPTDELAPIVDTPFEEFEDDPMWAFRVGGDANGAHEIQGRHGFCGAVFSLVITRKEFDRIDRTGNLDALIGELVDTIVEKHSPCPVLSARVKQVTIG